jgi:hypothetical protein
VQDRRGSWNPDEELPQARRSLLGNPQGNFKNFIAITHRPTVLVGRTLEGNFRFFAAQFWGPSLEAMSQFLGQTSESNNNFLAT